MRLVTSRRRRRRGTFRRAQRSILARAQHAGLLDAAPIATVDATGLEVRHVSTHYRIRRVQADACRTHQSRRWPKVTVAAHTHSHLILGLALGEGPTNDAPALRQAAALLPLDTVLADAAYDTEAHHRLCYEDFGIPHVVIALNPLAAGAAGPARPVAECCAGPSLERSTTSAGTRRACSAATNGVSALRCASTRQRHGCGKSRSAFSRTTS